MTQLWALILSLLIELPVVLVLGWVLAPSGPITWRRLAAVGCAATLITHPFAWHGLTALQVWLPAYWPRALLLECAVALAEGLLFARAADLGLLRGQLISWTTNAASFGVGLLLPEVLPL